MASARIHEAIAKEINQDYHMDEILLRIGTVAPDSWRNVEQGSGIKNKYLTHFWDFRVKNGQANNYEEFYFKYQNQLSNPFYFGYLIHLIVDQYWKTNIDPKYVMYENGVKGFRLKDGSFHSDENWFGYFESIKLQRKLAQVYHLGSLPIDQKEIRGFFCDIAELNPAGLFGPKGTLQYINRELSPIEGDEESQIYDIEDILAFIQETVEFVKRELERLQKLQTSLDKQYKIAVDIDDTLLSTKELETYYWQIFLNQHPDIDPNKTYQWGDFELSQFWSEYREQMAFGAVKEGASSCLETLLQKGYIVDLLTARPIDKYASLKKDLVAYFEENNLHYRYMHFGFYSKINFLREHHYNLLIDDDIRHIEEANGAGIMTILFGPHNPNYAGYQAETWSEVQKLLEKILEDEKIKS